MNRACQNLLAFMFLMPLVSSAGADSMDKTNEKILTNIDGAFSKGKISKEYADDFRSEHKELVEAVNDAREDGEISKPERRNIHKMRRKLRYSLRDAKRAYRKQKKKEE